MNKYSKLSKEELLEICKIIHPDTQWKFLHVVDEEGNTHEFIGDDESILQFNLIEEEYDELRFYYKGDIDGDLFDVGEDMVESSKDKINNYLVSLIDGNGENNNDVKSGDDYNVTEDEIKSLFVDKYGTDKFTKVEEYESKSLSLDNKTLTDLADNQAGISSFNTELENLTARLQRSNFSLYLSLIYRKKSEQDIFILKIRLLQINLSGNEFKVNALKDGKITFLFDDDETMDIGKNINYQEGTSELLYLETDISLLTKMINSKTVEYRLQGERGVVSESKLSYGDIINLVGFYNVLFDSTFRKDEILSFITNKKKKEEKKKKIEIQKGKTESRNIEKKIKTNSKIDAIESRDEDVVSAEINGDTQEKPKPVASASKKTKRKWVLPVVIASILIISAAVFFILTSKNSVTQEMTVDDIKNEWEKEYIDKNKLVDKENVKDITSNQNTFNVFNIRIKDGKNNINIRKEPINGSVIGKVSENEFYTVSEEYKSEKPIYLLNKKMILKDIQSEEKVEKPKNFKLNNVQSIDDYTYSAEVVNMDKTINKVRVKKIDVEISYSNWYYLKEIDGWIFSEFCVKLN
ncbi:hypothetical protein [Siansivirga zeaxanthinifaciens]|uniref:Uncharacterized protein n=1 Tax=Siansivirga zeaxanthinifaciens CC-SAMT-1 TaxID=1454006 RepID=A0A0C5WEP5_9FLAO|nr:hypothetical protein [Siansivirga zeaxanthinifaciens]AJR04687.1 hypothetical protein AW14_00030 [Siansivirga zeaxanthinifaciens CC-SAMT-1]